MENKEKIVMLRLVGGEFIIGKIDDATIIDENSNIAVDSNNKVKLTDSRIFTIQMTPRGAAIGFMPIFPFTHTEVKSLNRVEIDKTIIIQTIEDTYIDGEIINAYKSNITGIDMSAANKGVII